MSLLWHCAEPFFDHFSRDWASRHLNHWIPTPCAIVQHSSHQRRLAGYSQFVSICASGWRNFLLDHLCHNFGWLVPLFLIDPYRSLSILIVYLAFFGFVWHISCLHDPLGEPCMTSSRIMSMAGNPATKSVRRWGRYPQASPWHITAQKHVRWITMDLESHKMARLTMKKDPVWSCVPNIFLIYS